MASLLLRPLLRPQTLGLGLGLGLSLVTLQHRQAIRLDTAASNPPIFSSSSYSRTAKTPVLDRRSPGGLNPKAVRQVSSGSIIGLCAGLAVSTFSTSLAIILGLLIVGTQWASSYGINIIPTARLQRYFKNVDVRSAVQDNVAFKISFGMTFALAAFMKFRDVA